MYFAKGSCMWRSSDPATKPTSSRAETLRSHGVSLIVIFVSRNYCSVEMEREVDHSRAHKFSVGARIEMQTCFGVTQVFFEDSIKAELKAR